MSLVRADQVTFRGLIMIQYSAYLDNLILTVLTEKIGSGGFTGPLNSATLVLIQAAFAPTPQTTFGQLTEATYSGYARVTNLAWGVPVLQANGTYSQLSALSTFLAVGASNFVGNVIWGWALIDTANPPNLLFSEAFAQPVPIAVPGDGFGLVLQNNVGPGNPASFGNVLAAT